jgi:integrase
MAAWNTPEDSGRLGKEKVHQKDITGASPEDEAPDTVYPKETFRYLGREYRIFKRAPGNSAPWYFQTKKHGRRTVTSLRTSAVVAAVANAKLLIDGQQQNKLDKVRAILGGRETSSRFCSIEKYLTDYENTPTGENTAASRHQAALAFRRWMIHLPASATTMDKILPMFEKARELANRASEEAPDNASRMTVKRSFNSNLASAASVFSERAAYFIGKKLTVPDFAQLRVKVKFLRFEDAKKTAAEYNPPPQTVLDATLAGWADLPRNEFIAVGLALACGMRRGEIRDYAAWNWFEHHNGWLWVNARQGDFKDRTDVLRVQVLNPFYGMMMDRVNKEGWQSGSSALPNHGPGANRCITGNRSEFDRNVSAWMTGLGWQTRLHLHALRAWAGSLVYMKYGVREASVFCRHADEKTTKEHYGWLRNDFQTAETPVLVAGKPVEWAK